jgi:serine/threonine protein kinase
MTPGIPEDLKNALDGRYVLERVVGRGGMATVYEARDRRYDRRVAVKVLHSELSATLGAERFQREIQIAARLTHPHILALFDSGEVVGRVYYVMPFVEGESLRQRLLREGTLRAGEVVGLVREVAGALEYAHRQGVIHRDIKPENILLQSGHALVADFGVAKALTTAAGQTLTRTGFPVGTVGYMSPEQAAGITELGPASDVYSLAAMTYEMLLGELPGMWPGEEAARLRRFVDASPRIRELLDHLPGSVEGALVGGLLLRDTQRYPTPIAFSEALTEATGPTPRYDTETGDRILARAAELEATSPTSHGLSLGGLTRIAGEVGIPPEHVAKAALEVAGSATPVPVNPFLGSPTRLIIERTARGEFNDVDAVFLVEALRSTLGNMGQVTRLGRELSWQTAIYGSGTGRQVFATLSPGGGVTRIRLEENLRGLAGQLFGGITGGVGGGTIGIWAGIGMGVLHSPAAAIGLGISAVGGCYLTARTLFRRANQRRSTELTALADRLVAYLEDPDRRKRRT